MENLHDLKNAFVKVQTPIHQPDAIQSMLSHTPLSLNEKALCLERVFNGRNLWIALLSALRGEAVAFGLVGLGVAMLGAVVPWLFRELLIQIETGALKQAQKLTLFLTGLMVMRFFAQGYHGWTERRAILAAQQAMRRFLFRRLLEARGKGVGRGDPLAYVTSYSNQLTQTIYIVDFAVGLLTVAGLVGLMTWWGGYPALLALLAVVVITLVAQRLIHIIGELYHAYLKADHARISLVKMFLASAGTLRRQRMGKQLLLAEDEARNDQRLVLKIRSRWQTLNRTIEDHFPALPSILLVGAALFSKSVNATDLFPLLVLIGMTIAAVQNNLDNYRVLRNTLGPTRELENLLRELRSASAPHKNGLPPGALQVGTQTIPPNSRVAVVGRSGSGKTRLLKSLAGLPVEGALQVSSGGEVVLVDRRPPFFSGQLGEVVTLWDAPVNEERYRWALFASGLADDLARAKEGDALVLGGVRQNLSDGQRQRLALAQALYFMPDILLLDDVFAPLDPPMAQRILTRLTSSPDSLTLVYATSRMELVPYATHLLLVYGDQYELIEVERAKEPATARQIRAILGTKLAAALLSAVESQGDLGDPEGGTGVVEASRQLELSSEFRIAAPNEKQEGPPPSLRAFSRNFLGIFAPGYLALLAAAAALEIAGSIGFAWVIDRIHVLSSWSREGTLFLLLAIVALAIFATALRYGITFYAPIANIDKLHRTFLIRLFNKKEDLEDAGLVSRLTKDFQDLELQVPAQATGILVNVLAAVLTAGFMVFGTPAALFLLLPGILIIWAYRFGRRIVLGSARLAAATREPLFDFLAPALTASGFLVFAPIQRALEDRFHQLSDLQAAGSYWAGLARTGVELLVQGVGLAAFLSVLWSVLLGLMLGVPVTAPALLIFLAFNLSRHFASLVDRLQNADSLQALFERLAQVLGDTSLPRAGSPPPQLIEIEQLAPDATFSPVWAKDLAVVRQGQAVVNGFSFSLESGERAVIVGPSGAGKSSLMQALMGFLPLARGEVRLYGHRVTFGNPPPGYSLMLESQVPPLTISLERFIDPEGRWDKVSLQEACSATGLEVDLKTSLSELSAGERQLANFSRARLLGPQILLLDEATSFLDSQQEEEVLKRIDVETILAVLHRPDSRQLFNKVYELGS